MYNNFELGIGLFKDFSLTFDYSIIKNSREQVAVSDNVNPFITKYTYENFDGNESSINLDYVYSDKRLSIYASLGFSKPNFRIPFLNDVRIIKKPLWIVSLNNEVNIFKNTTAYINFHYESAGDTNTTSWAPTYDISTGIYSKFFKKKLYVSFSIDDVFKTQTYNWTNRLSNILTSENTNLDSRQIKISLKYNFNNFRNIFSKKSANNDILNRL